MDVCSPHLLKDREPFRSLFVTSEAVKRSIQADMKVRGYDPAFPIIVWNRSVDGRYEKIIIDGHTRAAVAKELRQDVTYVEKNFNSLAGALHYAVHCQKDRRNITPEALLKAVEAIDVEQKEAAHKRQKELSGTRVKGNNETSSTLRPKEPKVSKGESAEKTGEALGISPTQVKRIRTINNPATPIEIKEKVKKGDISISKGAELARAAKQSKPEDPRRMKPVFIGQLERALDRGSAYLGVHVLPLYEDEVEKIRIQKGRLDALYTQACSQQGVRGEG